MPSPSPSGQGEGNIKNLWHNYSYQNPTTFIVRQVRARNA